MKRPSQPRAAAELSKSLNQQLNMYALAASAAGVGLLSLASPAEGKIIYTPVHVKVLPFVPIDLNHDGIVDFYLVNQAGFSKRELEACQYVFSGSGSGCSSVRGTNSIRATGIFGSFGAALRYGERIQRGDRFGKQRFLGTVHYSRSSGNTHWFGPWMNGGKGVKNRYLGLRFKIKGRFHLGWARMTVKTTHNDFTATLTGYAYETIPGKAIIAGKTKAPDVTTVSPASLGHLAAGPSAIPSPRLTQSTTTNH